MLHKTKGRTESNDYRGTSPVAHVGKALLKVIGNRLSNYCEREDALPEEQCGFRPQRSSIDVIFVVRRLHQLARKKSTPIYMCFVVLAKGIRFSRPDSTVDRARSFRRVPPQMLAVIRHCHDGMCARIRTGDGERSDWFGVGQCLRQGCVLAPFVHCVIYCRTAYGGGAA